MSFAADTFAGTDGDALITYSASWIRPSWSLTNWIISDAQRVHSSGTNCAVLRTEVPASADYSVSADIYLASDQGGASAGVTGRASTAAATYYHARLLRVSSTSVNLQLYKFVSGSATQLGTNVAKAVVVGNSYNVLLRMEGTSIAVYFDGEGTPSISVTDAAITSAGFPGLRENVSANDTTGYHVDNFVAEYLSSPVSTTLALTDAGDVVNVTATSGDGEVSTTLAVTDGADVVNFTASAGTPSGDIRLSIGMYRERGGTYASATGLRYVVFGSDLTTIVASGSTLTTDTLGVAVIDVMSSGYTVGAYVPVLVTEYDGATAAEDRVVRTMFGFVPAIAQP